MAQTLARRVMDGLTDSTVADMARAEELADRALAASPRNPIAHVAKGQVVRAQGRCAQAAELADARRSSNFTRYSSVAQIKAFSFGYLRPVDATYIAGLRKAGVPEE